MGAATAVEKKAFVLFALFSALRERRCTPREVSIVDDVDGEVGGSGGESQQPTRRGIKFAFQTPTARCRPAPTLPAPLANTFGGNGTGSWLGELLILTSLASACRL